ncbi:MAG TPA: hypothetical protein VFM55_04915 [Micromonosporaceae bacterium]|nr:hypothetical protein [Micromonosporaceae bacterium]
MTAEAVGYADGPCRANVFEQPPEQQPQEPQPPEQPAGPEQAGKPAEPEQSDPPEQLAQPAPPEPSEHQEPDGLQVQEPDGLQAQEPDEPQVQEPDGLQAQEPDEPQAQEAAEADQEPQPEPQGRLWHRAWARALLKDLLAVAAYAAAAFYVTAGYWANPARRTSGINPADQALFEWFLSNAAYSVKHWENPLFSNRLDVPEGINLMANGSVLGMAVPLTPVTLHWGPSVAYVVMLTLIFLATATAWYLVLSRHVVTSRLAAFAGGAFCAFAPGMLSQATGHAHILAQFLVPVIIWRGFQLRESTRPVLGGAILGLLVAYQVFIGEEVLFLAALACVVVVVWYAAERPRQVARQWRPFLIGVAMAALVAGALLAHPLDFQFSGPRHYSGVPWFADLNADLSSYPSFSPLTVAGDPDLEKIALARDRTELNAYFGWPLLVLAGLIVLWLGRKRTVRITAGVMVVFAALSLGREVSYSTEPTGVTGLWHYLAGLPVFDVVVPTRFALVVTGALGVLLAVAVDHAMRLRGPAVRWVPVIERIRVARLVVLAVIVLALLPLVPRQLPVADVPAVPAFFTSGTWRQYVTGDGAVMHAVPNQKNQLALMRWAASQGNEFRITHGYFIAPDPTSPERHGTMSRPLTPGIMLLTGPAARGRPTRVGGPQRALAQAELAWREVAIVVMPPEQLNADAVRTTLDRLVGPGRFIGGVWVWDVRHLR